MDLAEVPHVLTGGTHQMGSDGRWKWRVGRPLRPS